MALVAAFRGEAMDNSKSKVRRKIFNEEDDNVARESGCWKFRFFGRCLAMRPTANASLSESSTEYAESKFTDGTSGDQPVDPVIISSSTASNGESGPPTPKIEEELRISLQLRKFTYNELKMATGNFRPDNLLGEGGFGHVFKGWIKDRSYIEMPFFMRRDRSYIDNLLGEGGFGHAFLHEEAKRPVIYRDFKTSNILLDVDYNAKLSDFGLAKDAPEGDKTHLSTRVMGTYGYAAPEYVLTGHLTAKSDVYSFGVVLLELLTGRRSMDKARPMGQQNLVEWARSNLVERRRFYRLVDPLLEGHYSIRGVQQAVQLASRCLSRDVNIRPAMSEVVEAMEPLIDLKDLACLSSYFKAMNNAGWAGLSGGSRNGLKLQATRSPSMHNRSESSLFNNIQPRQSPKVKNLQG